MIAFYVQGGGLGHLTRTHKLIQYLNIDEKEVLIITPSKFLKFFKQYKFVPISWNSSPADWSTKTIKQLTLHNIKQCYIDAFPLGIKGEFIPVYKAFPNISFIYICRILQWKKYLEAMPEAFTPNFTKTLVLETTYKDHLNWVKTNSKQVHSFQLPIIQPKKHAQLSINPYAILIHSGNKNDVIDLCKKVKAALGKNKCCILVFTQVALQFDDERFQFRIPEYPVKQYFKHATKIFTAAGFNLIHELAPYHKKHIVFPLDRLYDDQFFRTKNRAALLLK